MLNYIVMSDDDLFRSSHRPSGIEDYDFKPYDPTSGPQPFHLDVTDPRWYPGHPRNLHQEHRYAQEQERVGKIQPIEPSPWTNEEWGNMDPRNVGSMISYALLVSLVAYMFWVL